jgi:hypothetical protein
MKLFLLIAVLLAAPIPAIAQWQPEIPLTNDPAGSLTSPNSSRSIAASGDSVHVVWRDLRDTSFEIYYIRSLDRGATWGEATRLSETPDTSASSAIATDGRYLHVVWSDFGDDDYSEVYYRRSSDGGTTWDTTRRLTNASGLSSLPAITASGGNVHVVWSDQRDSAYEIYHVGSTDDGTTWGVEQRLTNAEGTSYNHGVTATGTIVNVIWNDTRDTSGFFAEVYQKRSTDGGVSWSEDIRLTWSPTTAVLPSSTLSGSVLHLVYSDNRSGAQDLYYRRSSDLGATWEPERRLTEDPGASGWASIGANGDIVYVVWVDNRLGPNELFFKRSLDGGTTWEEDARLVTSSINAERPSVALSGDLVHAIWTDSHSGNTEIYYKRNIEGGGASVEEPTPAVAVRSIVVYPNPVGTGATIEYDLERRTEVTITLVDITGRTVSAPVTRSMQEKGRHRQVIILPDDLAPGSYTIVVATEHGVAGRRIIRR